MNGEQLVETLNLGPHAREWVLWLNHYLPDGVEELTPQGMQIARRGWKGGWGARGTASHIAHRRLYFLYEQEKQLDLFTCDWNGLGLLCWCEQ